MDNEDDENKVTPDCCSPSSEIGNDKLSSAKSDEQEPATDNSKTNEDIPVNPLSNPAESTAHDKVTIKEIFNEIMDCTLISNPMTCNGNPNTKNLMDKKLSVIFRSNQSQVSTCTMKDVIDRILDYTICPSTEHSSLSESVRNENLKQLREIAGSSKYIRPEREIQLEFDKVGKDFQVYRSLRSNPIKSESAVCDVKNQQISSMSLKSLGHLLPSYSAVLKLGPPSLPPKLLKPNVSSLSFIPKQPPPSYAEVEGIWEDLQSIISSESLIFGTDPIYVICPRCRRIVITQIEHERSNFTHLAALVMSLCFCWPCCLLPYCSTTCSYTHHSCPHCHHYFGMHRPF